MLFDKFSARSLHLANHMVMAPMTRSRATHDHVPDAPMATYYGQRATAGLIITEGTSPSANGLGYPRIPGLFDAKQMHAWKTVTHAVHEKGGKIFVQLMHCGRVANIANLPTGAEVLGPTSVVCPGEMYTDSRGMQPHSAPRAMTLHDIAKAKDEYVHSAKLAIQAGFDGIELHGANGYLIEQFLNPIINTRDDIYGGSIEGRNRLRWKLPAPVPMQLVVTKWACACPHTGFSTARAISPICANSFSTWCMVCPSWTSCTCTTWTIRQWVHRQYRRTSHLPCVRPSAARSFFAAALTTSEQNRPCSTSWAT